MFPDESGKILVMPEKMSKVDLAKENQKLKHELALIKSTHSGSTCIEQSVSLIRSAIKSGKPQKPWPFLPEHLGPDSIKIPPPLEKFILAMLTGSSTPRNITTKSKRLLDSFGQDLIYAVSAGAQVPPKHILLPSIVKALTGNAELIQSLHRLGHGVSYSLLEEHDTALCFMKLVAGGNHVILPDDIQPYVFATLAWDNIDRLEETLTGGGTSHRVNGIAVQPRMFGPNPLQPKRPVIPKSHRKMVEVDEIPLPIYVPGIKVGPQILNTIDADRVHVLMKAATKNLIWMLTRQIDHQINKLWDGLASTSQLEVML